MRFRFSRSLGPAVAVLVLLCSACVVAVQEEPGRPVYTPPPPPPPPAYGDDYGLFYDDLEPYGEWVLLNPYGWVWSPWRVEPAWRPYTVGRWIYTVDGWFWYSDEPWGWATYHYGRWMFDPARGWIWIPGREWAPSWVAWRYGDGWIGWAPLPPGAVWRAGIGLDFGGADIDVIIQPFWWGFVDERTILDPRIGGRLLPPARNVTLVHVTRNVTRYTVVQNRVVVHGVDARDVERVTRKTVVPRRIVDEGRDRGVRPVVDPQEVRVFRPSLKETPPSRAPRAAQPRETSGAGSSEQPGRVPSGQPRRQDRPETVQPVPPTELPPAHRVETSVPRQPSSEVLRRQQAEQRELDRRLADERSRLERLQRKDERTAPAGVPPADMKKRHEAEQKALGEDAARLKQVLEKKQERERKEKPAEPAKDEKKGAPPQKAKNDRKGD